MADETLTATLTVDAPAEAVFAVLADPRTHADIDGTGWVRDSLDGQALAGCGQVFRMGMYHANHPDGHYEMANEVVVFDRPQAIAWKPGQDVKGDGALQFGGWVWRYDLVPDGDARTRVTLTYDWSAVGASLREFIGFPPFDRGHLVHSLEHLAAITADRS